MKKLCILFVVILLLLTGCNSSMPFNGDIEFHSISLTVPKNYIRDSTQSSEDLWVFEHGNYSKYILITRNDANRDAAQILEDYVELMKERETNSKIISFMNEDAVLSTYHQSGLYCQEIMFVHNGSTYAIALRGGTEAEFKAITDTIQKTSKP